MQYQGFGSDKGIVLNGFDRVGIYLHHLLYMEWTNTAMESEKPLVSFPSESLVSKYAFPVIYYVAGWTLHCAKTAVKVAASKRRKYTMFSFCHRLELDKEKSVTLPTLLVEQRKRRSAKVFCSKDFFDFICYVETVYLSNLTLKMMQAYSNGDILQKIKTALMTNSVAIDKFKALCNNDVLELDEIVEIMKYMMENQVCQHERNIFR